MAPSARKTDQALWRAEETVLSTSSMEAASNIMEVPTFDPPASPYKTNEQCTFLDSPAEIRNRIYSYAVVDDGCVIITKDDPNQPALLRVCRQVRAEAMQMFYSENRFQVRIEHPIETGDLPQPRHWLWTKPGRDEYDLVVEDMAPWYILKRWLRLVHQGAVHIKMIQTSKDDVNRAVNRALNIAKGHKGLSWTRASNQLEGYRSNQLKEHRQSTGTAWHF